jgi:YD repeat-containing protein
MSSGGGWNVGYGLYVNWPELTVTFARAGAANGADYDRLTTTESLPTVTWTHLVATYDGATMRVYFNGVEKASMASTRNIPSTLSPREFYIGKFQIDFGITEYPGAFYGWIDEAAVYSGALSPAQIQAHFLAGAIGVPFLQALGSGNLAGLLLALNPSGFQAEPVNTALGSFVTSSTDLSLPGVGVPFAFTRTYNSADSTAGPLGPGWTHGYAASLAVQANGDVIARAGDGQQLYFTRQGDGSFKAAGGGRATLTSVAGGYELPLYDQTLYAFDSQGKLLSIKDRNNQGLTFSQGADGPTSVTDSVGRVISFSYAGGLLTGVALPDGRSVSFGYTSGRLSSVTDARGYQTSYGYDAGGRLSSITDQRGNTVVQNLYDAAGRVMQQTDARGYVSTFGWDQQLQTSTFTDARGKVWTDVYANNLLIERRDPLGNAWRYEYDSDLNLTKLTDPRARRPAPTIAPAVSR